MNKDLFEKLKSLEKSHSIKIIFASEVGNRAYGIKHNASGIDLRFIYVNPLDHYLSFGSKLNSITYKDKIYNILGWDIKRFLELLKKSNLPILETLYSPNIQIKDDEIYQRLLDISKKAFNSLSLYHSLLEIIQKKWKKSNKKGYFYSIKAGLSILWLKQFESFPPLNLLDLIEKINIPFEMKAIIRNCLIKKINCKHPQLDMFIEKISRDSPYLAPKAVAVSDEELSDLLKHTIFKYFPSRNNSLERLQKELKQFVDEREWDKYHSLKNLALSVSIESGELLEHFQWWDKKPDELSENEKKEIMFEVADIFTYLLHICNKLKLDIVDITLEKLQATKLKYPSEIYKGKYAKPKK